MNEKIPVSGGAYVLADGDDVGAKLELYLLRNDIAGLMLQSERLTAALERVTRHFREHAETKVIFAGGDDLMVHTMNEAVVLDTALADVQAMYRDCCDQTLSVGVGATPRDAHLALRMAKLLGKNQISRG